MHGCSKTLDDILKRLFGSNRDIDKTKLQS